MDKEREKLNSVHNSGNVLNKNFLIGGSETKIQTVK